MSVPLKRYHFNVAEFYRMADAGILTPADRVELIEGEIIEMSPIGSRHAACVATLTELFVRSAGSEAFVWAQNPLRLNDFSEPQPDVALLRRREDRYREAHPTPDDVLLVVEVSDTTAAYDRGVKVPLYARSGIAEVWLIDLTREVVEIYFQPAGGVYQQFREAGRGDRVTPPVIKELALAVDEILG